MPSHKIRELHRYLGRVLLGLRRPRGGSLTERLSEEEVPIFEPQFLGMLPNLEFIASLSGGHIIKGRYLSSSKTNQVIELSAGICCERCLIDPADNGVAGNRF